MEPALFFIACKKRKDADTEIKTVKDGIADDQDADQPNQITRKSIVPFLLYVRPLRAMLYFTHQQIDVETAEQEINDAEENDRKHISPALTFIDCACAVFSSP